VTIVTMGFFILKKYKKVTVTFFTLKHIDKKVIFGYSGVYFF